MLDRFAAEADRLEAEARSIRGRVSRANLGNNAPVGLRDQLQASVAEVVA